MNNDQKLIELMRHFSAALSAISMQIYHGKHCDESNFKLAQGRLRKLDKAIDDFLLLKDKSKQPQPPDLSNTMKGEVPPVVNDGTGEHSKAVEGAPLVVRQNEQTKELCQCGEEMHDGCDCHEKNKCSFCGLPMR